MAQELNVDVQLYAQMDDGKAREDICVKNSRNAVDSENAFCSWEPDKVSIHKAIQKNPSQNGFDGIDKAVERIRLKYLLKHKVIDLEYWIQFYFNFCFNSRSWKGSTSFLFFQILYILNYFNVVFNC